MSDQPDEADKPGSVRMVPGDTAKFVDLAAKRQEKQAAVGETVRVPGGHTSATDYRTEVVQLIACMNCSSPAFKLAHDGRVICAVCSIQIMSLRWHDVNLSTVIPKSPA